ncbi:ArsR/SmtB family transcription factor [Nesterenkonia lacusekhoensis]|uniref:DNA-binding transcriptional ArsR family regulator n=1 Tax=Nesterenkonia lacusekhoensis TaxID=150832 RepID=A0ABS4T4K2_9MICC|nr:metalloregulator ArsR/SmtB family transcription factor [Nesterenkonia lacusekhoensis]MBP2319392.1 DNA-binding transcriptional ArsR family regulator [Nesterenkonia lacusekhoensis]
MTSTIQLLAVASDLTAREQAAYLVPTLAALADENRLTIVLSLTDGEKTNVQLQEATGLSQALVSHHVAVLRKAGLVTSTAQGRSNLISICCEQLATPVQWLAHLATLTPAGQQACCTEAAIPAGTATIDAD